MANEASVGVLAYLGDSVLELCTRRRLCSLGIADAGKLNSMALEYVRASSQARAMDNIEPILTEEESDIFRRGRNHSASVPKSASVKDYRRATGMEALFGWLYTKDRTERINELFDIAYPKNIQ